jgi:tRNA (guanine-N7-)-methyltransferase
MGPLISFDEIVEDSSFFYDIDQPLDWQEVFGNSNPLSLEVGFGNGKFLIEIAALNPQINFFGIDFYHKGIRKLVTRINKLQIQNIRILYGDARERIPQIFEADQLDSIFINFPDPWPKKRHIKRRLIKPKFIAMLTSKVRPGGHIHLATDSESYAGEMMQYLSEATELKNCYGSGNFREQREDFPQSKYERNFINAGEKIFYLEFQKCDQRPAQ